MSKVSKVFALIFLFSFSLLVYFPQTVSAANCTFTYDPPTPSQNMDKLKVTINSTDLATNNYRIVFNLPNNTPYGKYTAASLPFNHTTGLNLEFDKPVVGWAQGKYKLYLIKSGQNISTADCSTEFSIAESPTQTSCIATIPTKPIMPDIEVILHVEGIAKSNKPGIDIGGTEGYNIIINHEFKTVYSTDSGKDINLGGKFDVGTYLVEIQERCGFLGTACSGRPPKLQCNLVAFRVAPKYSGGGGEIIPSEVKLTRTCKTKKDIESGNYDPKKDSICTESKVEGCPGNSINTAIGCVHTDPVGFVKDFLTFIIGIAGGLAFLMMLLGTFQMLTSAGNPETLSAGRDRLQSAIIGLLFIIFSVLLLRIIGVDILGLGKQFGL